MNVKMYNVSDNPIKVTKGLGKETIIENVRFKDTDSLNVINPTLILNPYTDELGNTWEISNIIKFNYIYIPKTTRYYFITNISCEGATVLIETKVDVLMSFSKDIRNSKQYILRQENKYENPYLMDNFLPITAKHNYIMKPYGEYVDNRACGRVILETAGEGGRLI